jgi:hypothetical protein
VRSTCRLLALCTLLGGLWAACSRNSGPATGAYLRQCAALASGVAERVRALPAIALPARPAAPAQDATDEQQRIYEGLVRIHPLYVNQYHAAVLQRLHAITDQYGQALDAIRALDAAGVDPDGVQLVASHLQLVTEERDFYAEVLSLADHNQTSLVRRKAVDDADERLIAVFGAAIGDQLAAPGAVVSGLGDAAGALSKRQAEPFDAGDQAAKLAERAAQLQRDREAFAAGSAKLLASLDAKFPGQDWGGYSRKPGTPGK